MAAQGPRKRRTREHVIADLSVNFVEKCVLLCGWTVQRMMPDYGIDLLMTTFNRRGEIQTGKVRFQVKATDSLQVVSRRAAVAIRLEWRDVVYWLNERMPVILVAYDAKQDQAWWLNVQECLRNQTREKHSAVPITLTVHVPLANVLNPAAIREIATIRDAYLAQA